MWRDLAKRASNQPLGDKPHPLSPGSSSSDLFIISSKWLFGHLLPCLISSDGKPCLMCGVWRVVPPSGGSVGCSIRVQTEAAFIDLTNVLHRSRFTAWKLHIIHMKKGGRKKSNTFLMSSVSFITSLRSTRRRDGERWSGKLMKMSSFDICQLCEDFCLVSSAFCYANTTVSAHNGGETRHMSHTRSTSNLTNFNGKKRRNTRDCLTGLALWSFPHPNSSAACLQWEGRKT